jgi:phosphopantothenoylcysteine synthetase/decarboxylase
MPERDAAPPRGDALGLIVCGASAASALPGYLARLRQHVDRPLRVLLSASAVRFLNPEAISWYADEVYAGHAAPVNPTEFANGSYALVVLPASANTLAAAALGLAGTPAQTVLLAAGRPVLFFPSMNGVMWHKPSTRRHVATLRREGHTVVDPQEREVFELWSRQVIVGPALAPPDLAVKIISTWLTGPELAGPASGHPDPGRATGGPR